MTAMLFGGVLALLLGVLSPAGAPRPQHQHAAMHEGTWQTMRMASCS